MLIGDVCSEAKSVGRWRESGPSCTWPRCFTGPRPPSVRGEYRRVNVGGTEAVARAATEAQVRRIVLLSTISVYGHASGCLMDENTEPRPDTPYGRSKRAAEELVLSATRRGRRNRRRSQGGSHIRKPRQGQLPAPGGGDCATPVHPDWGRRQPPNGDSRPRSGQRGRAGRDTSRCCGAAVQRHGRPRSHARGNHRRDLPGRWTAASHGAFTFR